MICFFMSNKENITGKSDKIFKPITLEDLRCVLLELKQKELIPQFYKISDNLYCYRNKNTSYIGTLEFFEQVDREVRENIRRYGKLQ